MDIQTMAGFGPHVGAVTGTTPTTMTSPPPTPALEGTLSGIASLLGMSVTSAQAQLKSGQSINDLARQQGVSQSSLVSFAEQAIQQRRESSGQHPLDQVTLDRLVNRAFAHHRRPPGDGSVPTGNDKVPTGDGKGPTGDGRGPTGDGGASAGSPAVGGSGPASAGGLSLTA